MSFLTPLPDGVGVVLSKLIMGGKKRNRVTGVDLIEKICAKSVDMPIRIGFLGGFHNVAEIVTKRQLKLEPSGIRTKRVLIMSDQS